MLPENTNITVVNTGSCLQVLDILHRHCGKILVLFLIFTEDYVITIRQEKVDMRCFDTSIMNTNELVTHVNVIWPQMSRLEFFNLSTFVCGENILEVIRRVHDEGHFGI